MIDMIRRDLLDAKVIRMNSVPIYQILDEIEKRGATATYHNVITDEKTVFTNKMIRDFIFREMSMMFDEGDIITDGVGYTVVKNGEWSDYKLLPDVKKCRFCQLVTRENGD